MGKILLFASLCMLSATLIKGEFNKEEAIKEFLTRAEECRTEAGGAPSDLDDLIKKAPAATKEGKCVRACLMKKYKVMDDNGKFVKEVAHQHALEYTGGDEEKMKIGKEICDACSGISVPDDHCEAAEMYVQCFMEQAKAHGVENLIM